MSGQIGARLVRRERPLHIAASWSLLILVAVLSVLMRGTP